MSDELKENFLSAVTWIRAIYMLVFAVIYSIAEILLVAVVIFQFLSRLVFGQSNERLLALGRSLAAFIFQIIQFLTYNSEDKPFPFGDWPLADTGLAKPVRKKATGKKASTKKKSVKPGPDDTDSTDNG